MNRSRTLLAAGALASALMLPSAAQAYDAVAAADVNIRVGPGTQYGVIDTIPSGSALDVIGCTSGYNWCDVAWGGVRGWVSAGYISQAGNQTVLLPEFAVGVGLPIVTFSFDTYHDRWYRDRPWYHKRHWAGAWDRHDRDRFDRRDDRREAREDRRDDRREARDDRREDRREVREDRRDDRRRIEQRMEEQRQGLRERSNRDRREVNQRRLEPRQGQERQRALQADRPDRIERPNRSQRIERPSTDRGFDRRGGGGGNQLRIERNRD